MEIILVSTGPYVCRLGVSFLKLTNGVSVQIFCGYDVTFCRLLDISFFICSIELIKVLISALHHAIAVQEFQIILQSTILKF
jgi:hypothetical protein